MSVRERELFSTVRTEGVMLPASFIRRIAEKDSDIPGVLAADYHYGSAAELNEALSRAWNIARGRWKDFTSLRKAAADGDTLTTETREKWLLPLLQELGYGRLTPSTAKEIDGKTYPISHFWNHLPIHLVGAGVSIDRVSKGVKGASRVSPHGLVQEYLNRSEAALWAFVSNGLTFRILRDNLSLSKSSYIEFDLEGMMEGEIYSDFVVFWLLIHVSRVEGKIAEECYLEKWTRVAHEQGTRALDTLRDGVQRAIEELGRGFVAHPENRELRSALSSGALVKEDYYKELLRVVYRLIFLFVAEDRDLLVSPDTDKTTKERYLEHYSSRRLRRIASKVRGTKHTDHWQALSLVFRALGSDDGCKHLGLPALGSFLWSDTACPYVMRSTISNSFLLASIRELSLRVVGTTRRVVDFKNLGSEELGSVYESLLELIPDIDVPAEKFELKVVSGNERKTTGSYYTPTSLITCLLDSALNPVLDEKSKSKNPEQAILSMKVCDPACGSGHFLLAASHRMAARLARMRAGEAEPSPDEYRNALRDVIGHCIYGVDINPMAVELCKVSLWLEALEPGKPLSFLENRIQCGNSLIGATPRLLTNGIPDSAFEVLEGDDKETVSKLKRRNKNEREEREKKKVQGSLFEVEAAQAWEKLGNLQAMMNTLDDIDDSSIEGVKQKQKLYEDAVKGSSYLFSKFWADTWCAAFVIEKTAKEAHQITDQIFLSIEKNPYSVSPHFHERIKRIAESYRFLHWHVAFPGVFRWPKAGEAAQNTETGWSGGFDVVLGNPPWERVKLQEKEWFAGKSEDVFNAANAAKRTREIEKLKETSPQLYQAFLDARRESEGVSALIRNSNLFPLCGRGDVNTYSVFTELNLTLLGKGGRVGCIIPSGIATDDTTKYFFQHLIENSYLESLFDFENRKKIFDIDSRIKFCLLTLNRRATPATVPAKFCFFALDPDELKDADRVFELTAEDIALVNPNTKTCPIFRSRKDAEITKKVYQRIPVLIDENREDGNPWGIKFLRMFDMSNDSGLFHDRSALEKDGYQLNGNVFEKKGGSPEKFLPLYEAKMIHHFDYRWATYGNGEFRDVTAAEKADPNFHSLPRYWVAEPEVRSRLPEGWKHDWLMGWRDICRSTDERTFIASRFPLCGVGNTLFLLFCDDQYTESADLLIRCFSSFACDFITRLKVGGTHMTFSYMKQLPVPLPEEIEKLRSVISQCEGRNSAFDEAAIFAFYGFDASDIAHAMNSFPIFQRKEEEVHGYYRTKEEILTAFEKLAAVESRPHEGKRISGGVLNAQI